MQTPAPVTFDHLDLQVVADGRHSVPTQIRIDSGGESRTVDLPPIADQAAQNATVSVPLDFAPLTGSTTRVTVTGVRPVTTIEYHENVPITMPVGLAEVGIPGVQRARPARDAAVVVPHRPPRPSTDRQWVCVSSGAGHPPRRSTAIGVELCDPANPDRPRTDARTRVRGATSSGRRRAR